MRLPFEKYHGTGNDFILIDNRTLCWAPHHKEVSFLCDRHLGIGADGLILLSASLGYDFAMTYYNSDGRESTMCGNGGRCLVVFAKKQGLITDQARFLASDGYHVAEILEINGNKTHVRLKMNNAVIGMEFEDGTFINTGSPHFVKIVEDIYTLDVRQMGRMIRNENRFVPGGTNVDFVEVKGNGLFVRSYERGVEDETLSCGTGITASALAVAYHSGENPGYYRIKTMGGNLQVSFQRKGNAFSDIWLEGPAEFVFSGEIILERS